MSIFSIYLQVRWSDVDTFNHVSNHIYFNYFDEARFQWFASMGLSTVHPKAGPVVYETQCQFLKQLNFPAKILVTTELMETARTYFVAGHEVWDEGRQIQYAKGTAKIVWLEYENNKIVRLPPVFG